MWAFFAGVLVLGTGSTAAPRTDCAAHIIDPVAAHAAGLTQYWEARLPLGRNDSLGTAYLVDDVLYITTDAGSIFALTADAGLIRWGAKLTEAGVKPHPCSR